MRTTRKYLDRNPGMNLLGFTTSNETGDIDYESDGNINYPQ